MPGWLWTVVIVAAAAAVFALVWWSSGRSVRRPVDTDTGSANQRLLRDSNAIATMRNRDGLGPGPF
jgi:hypothetical protein